MGTVASRDDEKAKREYQRALKLAYRDALIRLIYSDKPDTRQGIGQRLARDTLRALKDAQR
jgi:hypothetical protein